MAAEAEVFEKVRSELVDALGVDPEEVTPAATIIGDLGAESIDFLDIVFRLENAFKISIKREELFPEDLLSNEKYIDNGLVTAEGLGMLKNRMPWADLSNFEKKPRVQDFGNILTVHDLCRFVNAKLS